MSYKRFKHDCVSCVFLGHLVTPVAKRVDLYVHPSERLWLRTVIARASSKPEDYISGWTNIGHYPELILAQSLANQRGLV